MKKNNKIGLLVVLMLLGAYNIPSNTLSVQAKTEGFIITADEQQAQIKANKDTYEKAKSYMAEKDFLSAINYLSAYIAGKPKKYEAYKLRGECYYALHKFDLAKEDFQTAIDIKTADDKFATGAKVVSAVVLGADKYEQRQNPELGILYGELMYAQKALNDPSYEDTYKKAFEYNSHIYLPQPKKQDIAKINCPQKYGKELNPEGIDADIKSVIEKIENDDYHEAAYKVSNITSAYPNYYFGHYLTGVVMAGLEQEKEAIPSFEKALQLNPDDFETMASLGQIYYSEAEKYLSAAYANKSVEYFEKALKYNPSCYVYDFYIGLNNLLLSKNDAAISYFDRAISLKSNDYNSMYYKLIAQYLKNDYDGVISGAVDLLGKRVSNSASVLYLRALAYNKIGSNEAALSDIEKAFSLMNDIYNADIKKTSKKEQTLPCYLYLLKSQIMNANGENSSQELAKAYENPIIREMSISDISEVKMSSVDFENQLDYIRTAFIDKKIMMKYLNPDYLVSSKGLKTPLDKENTELILKKTTEDVIGDGFSLAEVLATGEISNSAGEKEVQTPEIYLKESSDAEEVLSNENQPTIAQLLATQSVPSVSAVEVETSNSLEKIQEDSPTSDFTISYDDNVELPKPSADDKSDSIIITDGDVKNADVIDVEKTVMVSEPENKEIVTNNNKNIDSGIEKSEVDKKEVTQIATVLSAPVQKNTEEFTIKYDEPVNIAVLNSQNDESEEFEEDTMSINPFEVMDERFDASDEIAQVLPVISTPISKTAEPVKYLPTSVTSEGESVKSVANEIKETPDFKISYSDSTPSIVNDSIKTPEDSTTDFTISYEPANQEPVLRAKEIFDNTNNEQLAQVQNITDDIMRTPEKVEDTVSQMVESHFGGPAKDIETIIDEVENNSEKPTVIVAEKYADVDLSEFNVQKPVPQFNAEDEIIVFEPSTFIAKAEEKLADDDFGIKTQTKITDNFAQIQKQAKEYVESIADVNEQVIADNSGDAATAVEDIVEKVAENVKEPELIVPEAVISVVPDKKVGTDTKEPEAVESVAVQTINKAQTIVPTVRADKYSLIGEQPKEEVAAQKISEAQQVLNDFENKQRVVPNSTTEIVNDKEQTLWDFLSEEEISQLPVEKPEIKEQTLTDFLTDDFDEASVAKAKAKKLKKLNKRSKKEAQVASIVQSTLAGDTVNSDVFSKSKEHKAKKSLFKRENKVKSDVEAIDAQTTATIKHKSIKNFFNRKKHSKTEEQKVVKVKKVNKNIEPEPIYDVNITEPVVKEKKHINWFWRKQKTNATNEVKQKTEKLKKQKVVSEKKAFSLKNLFHKKRAE